MSSDCDSTCFRLTSEARVSLSYGFLTGVRAGCGFAGTSECRAAEYAAATGAGKVALRWRMPAASSAKEWVEAGLLLGYSQDLRHAGYRAGSYVARILNGASPLRTYPSRSLSEFEVAVHRGTLEFLGLDLPAAHRRAGHRLGPRLPPFDQDWGSRARISCVCVLTDGQSDHPH